MENFTYCNPTELVFGRGTQQTIGPRIAQLPQTPSKVMIIYGGGSAVRSGLLDQIVLSCEAAGLKCILKGGVKPNPQVDFVRECIDIAREQTVDVLLAVGGGSVIDTTKACAMGV